jgi:formylmethanofuran dehydrogenase subunit E
MGIDVNKWGTLIINEDTLQTNRESVFAGGDVVTGPNTVIAAIADGKKAAVMIDRYLKGEPLKQPVMPYLPEKYIAPFEETEATESVETPRVKLPTIDADARVNSLEEVELTLTDDDAKYEARRCLRCDLEFTYQKNKQLENQEVQEGVFA